MTPPISSSILWILALVLIVAPGSWGDSPSNASRPRAQFGRAMFDKVVPGMTFDEAMAAVRLPPGDYRTGRINPRLRIGGGVEAKMSGTPLWWHFDREGVAVWFQDGKVTGVSSWRLQIPAGEEDKFFDPEDCRIPTDRGPGRFVLPRLDGELFP